MRLVVVCVGAVAVVAGLACAPGGDVTPPATTATTGSGGSSSGGGDESTSSTSSSGSTSSTGGAGGMGGSGGGGGMGGCDFSSPNNCATAETVMEISATSGTDVRTLTGYGSKWFQVKMSDDNQNRLAFVATLTSAMGSEYSLFARRGDKDGPNCAFPAMPATGMPQVLGDLWPGELLTDNSRWYSFEVQHVSGTECDMDDQWTLTIEGNKELP